jgi:amidase
MDELVSRSVADLSRLLRDGEIRAVELTEAALRRVAASDGELNAFYDVDGDAALAEARRIPRSAPAGGIPIAIKASVAVAGRPLPMGSRLLAGHRATEDAYVVRRLRDAGFVVLGLTNMPEFGILPTTEPRLTGPTRNPYDHSRTPGGSSGGSAAAVAGGMVPVAHGTDGGGSLRIPAACCNLVGLKPSRGRVSRGPHQGDSFLSTDGVLTRTVTDTALLLDVLAGYEVGDATWAPPPIEPYAVSSRRDPGRLRVGVTADNPFDVAPDPEAAGALRDTAELLAALGHDVREVALELPGEAAMTAFSQVFWSNIAVGPLAGEQGAGRPAREDELEPLTRAIVAEATALPAAGYLAAQLELQRLTRSLVGAFAGIDVLLTPVLAERPLPIGELHGCGERPLEDFARSGRFVPYTALFNVSGQPAISVPAGFAADGLPTAVQLVGRPLAEDVLLQVAGQLEAARPWAHVAAARRNPVP